MGIILCMGQGVDYEAETLACNWWNWRATVRLLQTIPEIDRSDDDWLLFSDGMGSLTALEAERAAQVVESVNRIMPEGSRVRLDLSIDPETDDGKLYQGDEVERNYGASKEWLARFADFLRRSSDGISFYL